MHEKAKNALHPMPPDEAPIMLEPVQPKRSPWVLIAIIGVVGLTIATALGCVLMMFVGAMLGASGGLAGTWIQVDQPPSRAAQALLSVGTEVIADRVYVFSPFGSVTQKTYPNGSRGPAFQVKGTWKFIEDSNSAEDERTILIQFVGRQPQHMHIRFVDRKNAEFRFSGSYGENYFKFR